MDVLIHLFEETIRLGASDIHLAVGEPPVFRVDGRLIRMQSMHITQDMMDTFMMNTLSEGDVEELSAWGSIDFAYELPPNAVFRINLYRQGGKLALAARRIPKDVPTLSELALPEVLDQLTYTHDGLVLVTGPTGSGKSTTLAAMIEAINVREARHIITLEDPIEYIYEPKHSVIHQREIRRDVRDFASGLRAALRQDPDVILVGEMRDLETIRTAITAAETGHLVLSTLHTQDATSTIDRIIDVFPAEQQGQVRSQLAGTLRAVIAQRLLPQRQGGRVAVLEILINTPAVANLIRQEKTHQLHNIMQTSRQVGMQTFEQAWQWARETMHVDPRSVVLLPFGKAVDVNTSGKDILF
ncbi:MAG: Twitching motility protein PilT [Candidatus Carbobacillus altaicus]|uniref:Twitching motility protein PilT n=1 Tax=Candidatus Carbonibacillus altaicus TaxID=2163959 RepID=A0A2R6Y289_9BACL|nr:MAG: Twitching motility protein PilT [Candidatus Carbobacillus altaicus]